MSVGIGYDIHKLSNEGIMTLGGIEIKNMPAFKAESDGDVIMHSIIDALLGASNKILGNHADISDYFTKNSSDEKQNSQEILKSIINDINSIKKIDVNNLDILILAKKPNIKKIKYEIIENIVNIFKISHAQVSIKGKTNNEVGEIGQGKAVACMTIIQLND
ncbi:MAG: 2-C-methyl-D-erythritol 2,4-cyclodiphosphate synthase [Dehalococcoidaceae bacterium]|nr:2-C-methyl-D-erythritol 2,4-cyclodiphosphate synthase [Dehalococcoidaceae bacterium]